MKIFKCKTGSFLLIARLTFHVKFVKCFFQLFKLIKRSSFPRLLTDKITQFQTPGDNGFFLHIIGGPTTYKPQATYTLRS